MISPLPIEGTPIVPGSAVGSALVLDEPLSMWGGLDAETGLITDHHHPQHGVCVTASILLMPFGRGSSSASSVLAEAIRLRTAPRAIVLNEPDEILTLGCLVGQELYGIVTPLIVVESAVTASIATGQPLTLG